jgi:Glycosyl hydrolase family 1
MVSVDFVPFFTTMAGVGATLFGLIFVVISSKRFGIIYVDYATQRRIVKDRGYWYADFVRSQQS